MLIYFFGLTPSEKGGWDKDEDDESRRMKTPGIPRSDNKNGKNIEKTVRKNYKTVRTKF